MNAPVAWLRALADAMGALQAEEAFREAEIIAVGAGKIDKAGRSRVVRRWRKMLGKEEEGVRLQGKRSDVALLASLGMKVRQDGPR